MGSKAALQKWRTKLQSGSSVGFFMEFTPALPKRCEFSPAFISFFGGRGKQQKGDGAGRNFCMKGADDGFMDRQAVSN